MNARSPQTDMPHVACTYYSTPGQALRHRRTTACCPALVVATKVDRLHRCKQRQTKIQAQREPVGASRMLK
jgi:hypothetical protein